MKNLHQYIYTYLICRYLIFTYTLYFLFLLSNQPNLKANEPQRDFWRSRVVESGAHVNVYRNNVTPPTLQSQDDSPPNPRPTPILQHNLYKPTPSILLRATHNAAVSAATTTGAPASFRATPRLVGAVLVLVSSFAFRLSAFSVTYTHT